MTTRLPPGLVAWNRRGATLRIFGHEVFALDEGPRDGETVVLLHGFPSSSYDFHAVLPRLAERRRVVVHDHLGFGLSSKPAPPSGYGAARGAAAFSYSLLEQAEIAVEVWRALGIRRAHVVAHDYGTSVATELVARAERRLLPFEIVSLTLCNGSVHLELARLTPSQRLLRRPLLGPVFARAASPQLFKAQLRRILGRSLPDDELDAMWAGIEHGGGRARMPALSSYLDERVRFRGRWIGALARFEGPAHVLWGRKDPVAVVAIAERLAAEIPRARVTWLDDLGHYPMLEDPERWAEAANRFLDEVAGANEAGASEAGAESTSGRWPAAPLTDG